MIFADVKGDVKQELVTIFKKYLQNLKYHLKQACIFYFNFSWYYIHLDIVR